MEEIERDWQTCPSINGGFLRRRGGQLTETHLLKMAQHQEVEHIAKNLDKMVHKKNTVSAKNKNKNSCSIRRNPDQVMSSTFNCGEEHSGNSAMNPRLCAGGFLLIISLKVAASVSDD